MGRRRPGGRLPGRAHRASATVSHPGPAGILRERSSRDLSLGYFAVLLFGFVLWVAYGLTARNLALVIPNAVSLLVGVALVAVTVRFRR